LSNRLGTCKHLIHLKKHLKKKKDFKEKDGQGTVSLCGHFWDSGSDQPKLFSERPEAEIEDMDPPLSAFLIRRAVYTEKVCRDDAAS
jgi:hypothetical protein